MRFDAKDLPVEANTAESLLHATSSEVSTLKISYGQAPQINSGESCSNILFISTAVSFVSHQISCTHSAVQLVSVEMLLWCLHEAKYVFLKMANLARTTIAAVGIGIASC